MKNLLITGIIVLAMFACNEQEHPEEPDPVRRKSPIAIASVTHKPTHTYVKIVYGQPYKRGRKIFGGLEKFGEVWRTGANEATEITTTRPISFNGNNIEAGTYALFTIPGRQEWTIILNDSLGQWGAFDYKKKYDYLRTSVPVKSTKQTVEAFTIKFSPIEKRSSSIIMEWDTTRIEIPITFIAPDTTSE